LSHEAVSWAHNEAPMLLTEKGKPDITARQILVALADKAHMDGTNAYPSVLRLHFMTGVDDRTIPRVLARLETAGLIVHVRTMPTGNKNWTLQMWRKRPESEWEDLQAAAEKIKRIESERRQARRVKALSGTQSAGQSVDNSDDEGSEGPESEPSDSDVRHAECRTPAFNVPESGTQSADVRHSKRTEQSLEPSLPVPEPSSGATLPPDPLRENTPSARFDDRAATPAPSVVTDQPSLDPQLTTARGIELPEFASARLKPAKCVHGLRAHTRDGQPTCALCRRQATAGGDPP
jgi:DNA-binding transcriptional regulator YhcF (GntR family)